jgi:hypothetical protein
MKRFGGILVVVGLALGAVASMARAGVNIDRSGAENPVIEVSRSVIYGGLAGLVVGSAIAIAADSGHDGDIVRWSFAGGTVLGLVAGTYFVARRPLPSALIERDRGAFELHPPGVSTSPLGGVAVPLIAVRF